MTKKAKTIYEDIDQHPAFEPMKALLKGTPVSEDAAVKALWMLAVEAVEHWKVEASDPNPPTEVQCIITMATALVSFLEKFHKGSTPRHG